VQRDINLAEANSFPGCRLTISRPDKYSRRLEESELILGCDPLKNGPAIVGPIFPVSTFVTAATQRDLVCGIVERMFRPKTLTTPDP